MSLGFKFDFCLAKPTRGLLDQTPNSKMSSLPVGTTVKLEGLSSAEYNGKKGRVAVTAEEMAARGRIAVIVDGGPAAVIALA